MDFEAKSYTRKPFEFTGKASEYFGIWIVNIILTILTLGIYSAWAKVRTNQYFYGNTQLDGSAFQYLATPMQILKSRIIAAILFTIYYGIANVYPIAGTGLLAIILLLVPAIVVLSMSFRMRNTAYRNVTFGFQRDFKRAYLIFAGPVVASIIIIALSVFAEIQSAEIQNPEAMEEGGSGQAPFAILAAMLLILLAFPFWEFLQTQFIINNTKYGTSEFKFEATAGKFYKLYLSAFAIAIAVGALIAFAVGFFSSFDFSFDMHESAMMIPFIMAAGIFPLYLWMFTYIQTKKANLVYNHAALGTDSNNSAFESRLTVTYMFYLYITNTLAITLSLGLLIPWTMVRMARYRAQTITFLTQTDLDAYVADQKEQVSAMGEEFGDMFDIEVGI